MLGVLIGVFLVGNHNTQKTSNQKSLEATELADATAECRHLQTHPVQLRPQVRRRRPLARSRSDVDDFASRRGRKTTGRGQARTRRRKPRRRRSLHRVLPGPRQARRRDSRRALVRRRCSKQWRSPRARGNPPRQPPATAAGQPMPAPEQSRNDSGRSANADPPANDGGNSPDAPSPRRGSRPQPEGRQSAAPAGGGPSAV